MAIKIGITGNTNTGKSFSRKTITKGEEVFVIAPSAKALHITDSQNKPLKRLNIALKDGKIKSLEEARDTAKKETIHEVIPVFLQKSKEDLIITGNHIVCKIDDIENYLKLVDRYMPHIKTIILPDFTHYVSAVIASKQFISRKAGGEAYQRFWELAGKALESVILSIDNLREDLIVVTEYHSEYNEKSDAWEIFVPGGTMLKEKFKIDSYYDFMLYTHVVENEKGEVQSYNFVTKRWNHYPARFSELFKDTLIPNDLELVISKLREYSGI